MPGDRVALVTGAARGIGATCARALAAEGFRVAVHYGAVAFLATRGDYIHGSVIHVNGGLYGG